MTGSCLDFRRAETRDIVDPLKGAYFVYMNWQEFITVTPGICSGKPCVAGTRITVSDVLEYLAGGMTEAQILADFPELKPEHIRAVLAFAAERERRLTASPAA
jgi:uncharacterized protein (DUF433 family)